MKEIKIDLLPLIQKLEAVLKKGFSREIMAGNYKSVYKGRGMEFVGFREYVYEDDALLIDWKASLKAHKMMVRMLEEERNLTVFFLLDVSDSMLFSSHKKLKCEYAAELLGTMAYAMHGVGDNVGMALFTDKVIKVVPPGIGRNQFYKMVQTISDPSNYGGKFDFNYALKYVMNLPFLKSDSIVFLISDYIGLKPGWEHYLKLAGLKYDFTAVVVRDPLDMRMPDIPGEVHFSDPYQKRALLINPQDTKHSYEVETKNQILRLKRELNKTSASLFMLESDRPFSGELFKFFKMRQKWKG